ELPFQVPEDLLLLGRSMGILSGICTGLDPEFDVWGTITPYANQLMEEEQQGVPQRVVTEALTLGRLALTLPQRAERVLTLAERGELKVTTPALSAQVRRLERSVSRMVYVVVFAALLVAGAVLTTPEPGLGRTLMLLSAVPLLMSLGGGRRRDR
ncbi:MAG: AarF/ABC1/UbiB kinase family protein, partial [Ornithinimicrobium sp.]